MAPYQVNINLVTFRVWKKKYLNKNREKNVRPTIFFEKFLMNNTSFPQTNQGLISIVSFSSLINLVFHMKEGEIVKIICILLFTVSGST